MYKVKTIGDAFFAISGPACLIEDANLDEQGSPTLRMLRFASDCVQIFSGYAPDFPLVCCLNRPSPPPPKKKFPGPSAKESGEQPG